MINQIGLTDTRAAGPRATSWTCYKGALARDYAEIIKGMRAYYVNWKPEYMKYVKIHYGWTQSGDWPRMAMVRALQQQAIANDPVVYDWPHIKARTLVIGGEKDGAELSGAGQARRRHRAERSALHHPEHRPQPAVRGARQALYPPLLKFLKGEDVGTKKAHDAVGSGMPRPVRRSSTVPSR